MSTKEMLLHEADGMPEPLLQEVLSFMRFLRVTRTQDQDEGTQETWGKLDLSKTAFADNWEGPEEDEAWKDLVAGDVVVVDYPYTDFSQTKRRPALVLYVVPSTPNIVLCQITSQFKTDPDAVTLTAADFAAGGLTQPVSNARPNYLLTLHRDLAHRVAGRLTLERFATVRDTVVAIMQR